MVRELGNPLGNPLGLPAKRATTFEGIYDADYTKRTIAVRSQITYGNTHATLASDLSYFLNNKYTSFPSILHAKKSNHCGICNAFRVHTLVDVSIPSCLLFSFNKENKLLKYEAGNVVKVLIVPLNFAATPYPPSNYLNCNPQDEQRFFSIGHTSNMGSGYGKVYAEVKDDLTVKAIQFSEGSSTYSPVSFYGKTPDNKHVAVFMLGDYPSNYPVVLVYDSILNTCTRLYTNMSGIYLSNVVPTISDNKIFFGGLLNNSSFYYYDLSDNTHTKVDLFFKENAIRQIIPSYRNNGGVYLTTICSGGSSTPSQGRIEIGYFVNGVYTRLYSLYDKTFNDNSSEIKQCFETKNYFFVGYRNANNPPLNVICINKNTGERIALVRLNHVASSTSFQDTIVDFDYDEDKVYITRTKTYGDYLYTFELDYMSPVLPVGSALISAGLYAAVGAVRNGKTPYPVAVDLTKFSNFATYYEENTVASIGVTSVADGAHNPITLSNPPFTDVTSYFTESTETVLNDYNVDSNGNIYYSDYYIGKVE